MCLRSSQKSREKFKEEYELEASGDRSREEDTARWRTRFTGDEYRPNIPHPIYFFWAFILRFRRRVRFLRHFSLILMTYLATMAYPASVFITGTDRGIGLGLVREFLKVSAVKHVIAGALNPDTAEVV
ncbi:hypothetical protein Y032_0081g1414 [Ancylostoma ceylanicum]|uniref:Uncharacterized protein n=1 Tax=Ancylostoma ceylanicum TaxID=53326 RepID=A0A016TT11_9BILA|nr:hypothetical protein Y032_0081g1414 [Ancylostoma ceylanicum]